MTNQVTETQQQAPQRTVWNTPVKFQVNGEEVKLSGNTVMNYLVRGNGQVSEQEVVMFTNLCKFQKLNPFLNEAYLVKFGAQPASIIVSKEAFMKRAENHPKFKGFEAGIVVERNDELVEVEGAIKLKNDLLIGGWCKVHREDRKAPITVRIALDEFTKGQATWKQMPLTMIRKSAIVNALREAFPETLGAMYTEDDADINKSNNDFSIQAEIQQHANNEPIDIVQEEAPVIEPQTTTEASDFQEAEYTDIPQEEAEQPAFDGPGF